MAFVSQVIAFCIALLGTFFKCIKEDGKGKRIYSSNGIPALTIQGKCILALLVASFGTSFWLTWNSAKEHRHAVANLENNIVGRQTPVKSLQIFLFLDKAGTNLGQRWQSSPTFTEDLMMDWVFCPRQMRNARLNVPVGDGMYLQFLFTQHRGGVCTIDKSVHWGENSSKIDLEQDPDSNPAQGYRAVFNIQLDSVTLGRLNPDPDQTPNMESFTTNSTLIFTSTSRSPEGSDELSNEFQKLLPKTIGVRVVPNMSETPFATTRLYTYQHMNELSTWVYATYTGSPARHGHWNAPDFLFGTHQ